MAPTGSNRHILSDILQMCDLKLACLLCTNKENEVTYSLKTLSHQCRGDLLLAKGRDNGKQWRHISRRPEFPNPSKYEVCWFFKEGSGCKKHRNRCTFARSKEEATVWTIQKHHGVDHGTLVRLVAEAGRHAPKQIGVAQKILTEFGGDFLELCERCFYSSPQTIAGKTWSNTCASEAAHEWKPALVHQLAEGQGKRVYSEIRRPPPLHSLRYCGHVAKGLPCWHRLTRCQLAHSEVEMAVWKEELNGGFSRKELVLLSQKRRPLVAPQVPEADTPAGKVEIYCKACLLTCSSKESFVKHCASLEHARMISEDSTIEWKYRPPPHNRKQEFSLCERPETCEYGERCTKAHCVEELQEWQMQTREAQEIQRGVEAQGLTCYRDRVLQEYRSSSNEVHIMSEHIDDVTVTHDMELSVECERADCELRWIFQINTERLLAHVALLKQESGATFTLGEVSLEDPCTYSTGERFCTSDMSYDVPVSFKAVSPGLYEQWLVFDFDMRPVLLQKLKVRVGQHSSIQPVEAAESQMPTVQSLERWHQGNRHIIPCLDKSEAEEELLKEYKPPQINLQYSPGSESSISITSQNYRERMHSFLYTEELAQEEVVSRLCVQVTVGLTNKLCGLGCGMKIALPGELFAAVPMSYVLTPDTPEGFILKRAVRSALVAPSSTVNRCNRVYEAVILPDVISENRLYLKLSKRCCSELRLLNGTSCEMEVQFQLNRLQFCERHKAVDLLPDVGMVLPDLRQCCVPEHHGQYPRLNTKQHAAMSFILGDSDGRRTVAPLLIYGPFGTGKTFTLATAAKELVRQPGTRVLICTHTNSSADLYVKDHFHHYVNAGHLEAKPLRVKADKGGVSKIATDDVTLQYCHLDGQSFAFPKRATLDSHRVVITTTVMARYFHDLKLPGGYFTHILIDEASQMLECEALIPLGLAGAGTRVVLAGDHMQMGPKLFSVDEDQRSNHTLLNRLFHYYQAEEKNPVALKSRIILNENYRSTQEIVDFVSAHFYVGTRDAIKASGNVPPHPKCHPLRFHHVRGECHLDTATMSWYNLDEIAHVVSIVRRLFDEWPAQWGNKEQRTICVLSEGSQVFIIRKELQKISLGRVTVENVSNVQGKQFRVVVMTTVHTRDSLCSSDTACLEFFNDARVLNTVMTRAQSQVVVVGDAAALCYFGRCSKIWKSYIEQCIRKSSAEPRHLTEDHVEQEVREISMFQRAESKDIDDLEGVTSGEEANTDEILQQLMEDNNTANYHVSYADNSESGDGEKSCQERRAYYSNTEKEALLDLVRTKPDMYKYGELVREKFNTGYVMPFDNPVAHVQIKGRENMGMSFSGDEVVVQITTKERGLAFGKVLGITKSAESSQVFVCTFEDDDNRKQEDDSDVVSKVMVPLNKSATKIRILCSKRHRNKIPIWKLDNGNWKIERYQILNEKSKRNHVFVVEVVLWKEHCLFPLGKVTDVIPMGTSLEEGLKLLDMELRLEQSPPSRVLSATQMRADAQLGARNRLDFRNVITFTVDPETARDLDDAISVKELDSHYELGVHIADVASIIPKGSPLDDQARKRGVTYYPPKNTKVEPKYMFPRDHVNQWSLLPGSDRNAVSLIVEVEKTTNRIVNSNFVLSRIKSDRKLSYEEAEDIIAKHCGNGVRFDTLEGCLAVAYLFSREHRKARLQGDWHYAQPDNGKSLGKRKSHQMIEELMIMFNNSVSEFLIEKNETVNFTPLRCQARPSSEHLRDLEERYKDLIPMSNHLTFHIGSVKQPSRIRSFCVLTHLWKELQSAARRREIDKIADLINTDDIHPQLLPVTSEFRRLLGKAYIIRANSAPAAKVGHYSLQLDSYTKASSPIRSYLDVILQRLLHAILNRTPVPYSTPEIDMLCQQFENNNKKADEYQKKAETLVLAVNLKKQNAQKLAFVTDVQPEGESFRLSFPFDKDTMPDSFPVLYRDLLLEDQPLFDKDEGHMKLTWRRRVYSVETAETHLELKRLKRCNPCTDIPLKAWQNILEAVKVEKWDTAISIILTTHTGLTGQKSMPCLKDTHEDGATSSTQLSKVETQHYIDLALELKCGDTLPVQMTTEIKQGILTPAVQLLNVNAKFEVCVNHAHSPVDCFSKCAEYKTRPLYSSIEEYARIWRPLCEMESASTAVDESDSIIIEDLELTWNRGSRLEGSFILPKAIVKDWAIECNLAKCFLCIRKRDLKQTSTLDQSEVDPSSFTWVAHGVTTALSETGKLSKKVIKVDFYINHLPMDTTPDFVFKNSTKFTVEIIPKLLPDVRKENAVNNLRSANELVEKIVLGWKIPKGASDTPVPRWRLMRNEPPPGLPMLNESQYAAIEKALKNNFTLIQGPPGTGKTVVGAYIVYWFFVLNSEIPRQYEDPKDKDKKEVILYCGPSNKSVDVIAEYLMKFGDKLKPLRVYSRQMEMLEYPYPGSILQLSRKSLRQERSRPEIKSITMHHRIREPENPHSQEILHYDEKIRLANESKGEELTDDEVEAYKKLLNQARLHELKKHDVILCTCTAASTPNLTKTVSARQILIDECAMATEPQALIPLVSFKPEKIVLLGDHKQLRPIVKNTLVRKLGMSVSLFERYMARAVLLDTQYRMHKDICEFPSMESYQGRLQTAVERENSVLLVDSQKTSQIVFGHIDGEEVSLVVTTEKGNENSKANREESRIVVGIAESLVNNSNIPQEQIAILSPYNAQVSEIKNLLKKNRMHKITVSTITKSQGSEWRYVILSTVRSCPREEIEAEPSRAWLSKHVGFVGDPNQINVGITRAQQGLCIIGNQVLLRCSKAWESLLRHYTSKGYVTNASDITARKET
ncbi:helicase with zinc finger domain 2-like [Megalops cyprinoides]|uniref:helicase with zinc finger domain 2-like n=1 Tax=Megalops cyprinoides TaxID=118141 RepID=UPI001864FA8E|nr:helicase with zinc finger domain 2-like [Megalops cyprinoides]